MTDLTLILATAAIIAVVAAVAMVLRRRRSPTPSATTLVASEDSVLATTRGLENDPSISIEIEALDEARAQALLADATKLDAASRLSRELGRVVGPAVQLAVGGAPAAAQHGKFLVQFSAKGTAGLASGALKLMSRGSTRQATAVAAKGLRGGGAIVENATIAGAAGKVANAAAVAHLVIVLAVQAQLVSMERALERVEKAVTDLLDHADDQQIARVRGRLKALAFLRDEMSAEAWTAHDRQRWLIALDQADTELHQVADLAAAQCVRWAAEIKTAPLAAEWFSASGETLAAQFCRGVDRFRHHLELRMLCTIGQLATAHLRKGLGAPNAAPEISATLKALEEQGHAHAALVEERSAEFATKFRTPSYDTEKRKAWMEGTRAFRGRLDETLGGIREHLAMLTMDAPITSRAIVEIDSRGAVHAVALLTQPPESAIPVPAFRVPTFT